MSNGAGALLVLLAGLARAQSVEIYSEFQRPDPFGGIVRADKGWRSREILSPAVARGGFASFHVAVSVPAKESYLLYVVTNPIDACRVSLYKEHFVKVNDAWIPDRLTEITRLPDFGAMPDAADGIEGQNTRVYLLDVWIPPDAGVGRFRLEVQLKTADWIIRPMEIRVEEPRIPALPEGSAPALPKVGQGADAPAIQALTAYVAGRRPAPGTGASTVRAIVWRNAVQDMALAGSLDSKTTGPAALQRRVLDLFWVNSRFSPRPFGSEWYLRIRDFLFAQR